MSAANVVSAINLQKRFGDVHAVAGVNFAIRRGELFGLLGPNGAGKTTTIHLLTGLLVPDEGEVTMLGEQMGARATARQRRRAQQQLGVVPQELALYPTLSARDNLAFFGRLYGLRGKELAARIAETLDLVGLRARAGDAVATFSGGMKRRVNIAAGLLHRPALLFLDEPTVGVDPQSRNAIFDGIERLRDEGLTIVYTTHYMEEAERLCDRIAIMDEGRIIALDTADALVRHIGGGLIRLGLRNGQAGAVAAAAGRLPTVRAISQREHEGAAFLEVETTESRAALLGLLEVSNRLDAEITRLEVLEPNLETVFLHLTGKALRD